MVYYISLGLVTGSKFYFIKTIWDKMGEYSVTRKQEPYDQVIFYVLLLLVAAAFNLVISYASLTLSRLLSDTFIQVLSIVYLQNLLITQKMEWFDDKIYSNLTETLNVNLAKIKIGFTDHWFLLLSKISCILFLIVFAFINCKISYHP